MALNLFRTHLNLFYKMRFNLENKILHTYKDRATKCGSGLLNLKRRGKTFPWLCSTRARTEILRWLATALSRGYLRGSDFNAGVTHNGIVSPWFDVIRIAVVNIRRNQMEHCEGFGRLSAWGTQMQRLLLTYSGAIGGSKEGGKVGSLLPPPPKGLSNAHLWIL